MSLFSDLCRNPSAPAIWLVEVNRFVFEAPSGDGVFTFNEIPFNSLPDGEESVQSEATLRFADGPYTSLPGDDPANTNYETRTIEPGSVARSLPLSPLDPRRVNLSTGELRLTDAARELDPILEEGGIDGRRVRILMGQTGWALAEFGTVFSGVGVAWWREDDQVVLRLRDNGYRLHKTLQTAFFAGTGGIEGGANLEGRPLPLGFGPVWNFAAVLVNGPSQIYRLHARAIHAVDAVFDGAAAITAAGANYADYAALVAAVVPAGQYATCLALALIRLGSSPSGMVTVDFRGDAVGGYVDTTGAIARRLITDFAGLDVSEIDADAFAALDLDEPAVIGWSCGPQTVNSDAALDEVFGGIVGWWGSDRAGLITCGQLEGPSEDDAEDFALDAADILDLRQLAPESSVFPPPWRIGIGYRKVQARQEGDGLAGAATTERKDFVAKDFRFAFAADAAITARYRQAQQWPEVRALYDSYADAKARADAILAAYRAGLRPWLAKMSARRAYLLNAGRGGRITYPARSFSDQPARIISIDEIPGANEALVKLWI